MSRAYIKPPRSHEVKWHDGPPPEIGWWPASFHGYFPDMLRWWDGTQWSMPANDEDDKEEAARCAALPSLGSMRSIRWCARWWE